MIAEIGDCASCLWII